MAMTVPRLTMRLRMKLFYGKLRRLGLAVFRRGYIRRSHERRLGECARCGACCQLAYRCHLLRDTGCTTECRLHKWRPVNCRIFPIDERDLAERDLLAPDKPCGYSFRKPK